jgi:hypothetical protein
VNLYKYIRSLAGEGYVIKIINPHYLFNTFNIIIDQRNTTHNVIFLSDRRFLVYLGRKYSHIILTKLNIISYISVPPKKKQHYVYLLCIFRDKITE